MRFFYAIALFAALAADGINSDPAPPAAPPGTRLVLAPADTAPRLLASETAPAEVTAPPAPATSSGPDSIADPQLRRRTPAARSAAGSRVGAVTIGDLTLIRGADGRTTTLTQSGNLLIRQDAKGTSFTRVEDARRSPVFLQDSDGKVTGPMSTVPGSESPKSTLPSRPAVLPPPRRDTPPRVAPRPARNSFSSVPSRPKTLPPPGRIK